MWIPGDIITAIQTTLEQYTTKWLSKVSNPPGTRKIKFMGNSADLQKVPGLNVK